MAKIATARKAPSLPKAEAPAAEAEKVLTIADIANNAGKGKLFQLVAGQGKIKNSMYDTIPPPEMFEVNSTQTVHQYNIVSTDMSPINASRRTAYLDSRYKVVEVPKTSPLFAKFMAARVPLLLADKLHASKHHSYIGSDPEIFAEDEKGELIPAFTFLRSKKESPRVYWDGYQAEFAPKTDTCLNGHIGSSICNALNQLRQSLAVFSKNRGRLVLKNTFDIPLERLKNDAPEFVAFGCTPSINVYGESPIEVKGEDVPFRTAGGHLHFTIHNKKLIPDCVKELDRVLGVISVAMFRYWDTERRRMFYGRAGEYRTPSYGMEYRVLSNAWLAHTALAHFVFEVARVVIGQVLGGSSESNKVAGSFKEWDVTEEEARKCINECDVDLALKLLERNDAALTALIRSLPGVLYSTQHDGLADAWKSLILKGADKSLKTPDVLSINWETNVSNMSNSASKLVTTGMLD